eukprot:TCONS_00017086-protein
MINARQWEEAFSKRNHVISEKYNRHAKTLPSLSVGATVVIQNHSKKHQRRWIRSGMIVETLPNRQYRVRTNGSGRVTLQNRRFLRLATFVSPTAPDDLNQTESTIEPVNRLIEIRLSNAIESQSNVKILGNIQLVRLLFDCGSIVDSVRLRSSGFILAASQHPSSQTSQAE